jgi:quercetin dioxygenase-like cupin family protein
MNGQAAFTGRADLTTVAVLNVPPARVSSVSFSDGAVTHWHSHEGGQVIYVVSGTGRYCERDGTETELLAGQHVITAPGVEHYHGAAVESDLHHIAISSGKTTWKETPEQ